MKQDANCTLQIYPRLHVEHGLDAVVLRSRNRVLLLRQDV